MQLNLSGSKIQKKSNSSTIFSRSTGMFDRICNVWCSNEYHLVFGKNFEQQSATSDKVSLLSKQRASAVNVTLCETLHKPAEHHQADK